MHGDLIVRGWFVWFVYAVTLLLLVGAVGVVFGALRRPLEDFGRWGRTPWVALQGVFLALAAFVLAATLLGFATALPTWFAGGLGFVVVAAGIQQLAYLLRVVYPSPRRRGQVRHVEGAEIPAEE